LLPHSPSRTRKWLILLLASYYFRAPILTAIANAWIVNDPLQKAGAILGPGGGIGWRPMKRRSCITKDTLPGNWFWMLSKTRPSSLA
jgi:hypothetical protein